jgi:putative transposase
VWCPKYRRKVSIEGVDVRLKEILALVAIELNSELIEVNYRTLP